ncbi:hypothetical protein [Clostridium perfringens]|uniref:hypothetical protein n=1 Tax=Clostridium perfringens TaxID=1502 RepID=UPI0024BC52E7|nr:hypothetical protein [Clostridium perfringens]
MNTVSLIADTLMEMIPPIALIVIFIAMIYILVILCLDSFTRFRNHNECEEDDEWDIIQKAIITIGDEKIEVEVDDYEIENYEFRGKKDENYVR